MKSTFCLFFLIIAVCFSLSAQSLTSVILPSYIEGVNGTNSNRIPFTYRVRLTGLTPSATYRYFNQFVISTDAPTSNGAGNCIFAPDTGSFVRTTSPGLSAAGGYGSFTTDAAGAYEGWFITEPTGNARLVPGKYIFMRIILNNGAGGTTAVTRLTTNDSVRVLRLDPAVSDSTGTGLRCTSSATAKGFVFVYSDTGGTGRPISGSFVESDGTANTTGNSYASFYANSVDAANGAFGLVLPNALSAGIRRVEQRSRTGGALVASSVDIDGIWPSGASTVNPAGGTVEIVLAGTDLIIYSLSVNATHGTVTKAPDQPSYQHGTLVQLTANPDTNYHLVSWSGDVPAGHETDNPLTVTMDQNRTITAGFALFTSSPTLTLPTSANITPTTAILGAKVISDGNDPISERGVVWSTSAGPTTAGNKDTTSGSVGTYTILVDSLPAGTLIHFRGFAINGIGTGYSSDATFCTLSAEPTSHAGSFAASAVSANHITLSWSAAAGATGYIILQRVSHDPTGLPIDAAKYAVGDTIGDGLVAAVISSGAATSADITGLLAATLYHYSILPYAWDGSNVGTYNYKTDGTIPTANAMTLKGPEMTAVLLPRTIEGISGTNTNRIPFAYRAKLTRLLASAAYRFANQVVVSSDADSSDGSGNCIFVSSSGDFVRTSGPSLAAEGAYGTFTTDTAGVYEGWFITEPTGNKRFIPGQYIFMRLWLNDGASGTTAAAHITLSDSVRVVKLDPSASDSTGTGLRCTSTANPKDFVFVYADTSGSGRPISGSFIESDGTANTFDNKYADFYADNVDGVNGAFGLVLPNVLTNGVRRIERRSLTTGALLSYAKDADGVWPSGANTVNPSGGTTEIILAATDFMPTTGSIQNTGVMPREFAILQNYPNPFNPTTTIHYQLPVTGHVVIKVYDMLGREVTTLVNEVKPAGYHSVVFSADGRSASGESAKSLSSGIYFYRITAGTFTQTKRMMLVK